MQQKANKQKQVRENCCHPEIDIIISVETYKTGNILEPKFLVLLSKLHELKVVSVSLSVGWLKNKKYSTGRTTHRVYR